MIHLDSITAIVMEVERMTTIDAIVNMTERGGRGTVAEVGMMNAVGDTIAMRGVRIGMKVAGVIEVIDGRGIDMSTEKGTGMEVGREKGRGMEEEVERIEEGGVTGTTTIVVDIVSAPLFACTAAHIYEDIYIKNWSSRSTSSFCSFSLSLPCDCECVREDLENWRRRMKT
mmetsp:Transcript_24901/g.62772  ORF Transcript_24901/g.62772 Transcript_24901/m.62772 type:complete len:171 (-) Transcript_24901:52-564(-)